MTQPPEDHQTEAPDWAFSPDSGLKCPECDKTVTGLDWIMSEPEPFQVEGAEIIPQPEITGMDLRPCGHVLDSGTWELKFSGRSRQFGTIIRTPKFDRIDGS